MTGTSLDDELAVECVPRMVREIVGDRTAADVTRVDEGTDDVFFVTVEMPDGDQDCVLKACSFVNPPSFRVEPRALDLVGRRTDIPVPDVLGYVDDHEDLPAPFFLMERASGEQITDMDSLDDAALERTAHDAGRHLGELHAAASFAECGGLRADPDVDCEPTVGDLAVPDPDADWPSQLRARAEFEFDLIADTRFAEMLDELRAGLDTHLEAVPSSPDPVIVHGDYRFGNLLADAETGAVRTVLDWGNLHTGHGEFDLAATEHYLCGRRRLDADRRHLVRDALLAGYSETNDLTRDDAFRRRRQAYLFVAQLSPLAWFDLWYGESDNPEKIASRQKELVRSLLP
ncbi:phosphotransferase family protein [Haladaptatus sp. NG-SE-30]